MTVQIGQTGRATFYDGMWTPSEPSPLKDMAKKAGASGDGSTLLHVQPMTPGHDYVTREIDDGLGGKKLHLFSVRKGPTAINPNGPVTTGDAVKAEFARNASHAAGIREFWDKQAAADAKVRR